jgi:hypothetical protein
MFAGMFDRQRSLMFTAVCVWIVGRHGVADMDVKLYDWFSFSHWGVFRLPLLIVPDWFADGLDIDDECVETIVALVPHPRED